MVLQNGAASTSANGKGWEEDVAPATSLVDDVKFPLAISGSKEIDIDSLLKDLQSNLLGGPAPSANATKEKSRIEEPNRAGNVNAVAARRKMYLDSMEAMDDADRLPNRKQQETVDLVEFVDTLEDESPSPITELSDSPSPPPTIDDDSVISSEIVNGHVRAFERSD